MKKIMVTQVLLVVFFPALVSCGKRVLPPVLVTAAPPAHEREAAPVAEITEPPINLETHEALIEEPFIPGRIIVPYLREYLSPGQETTIIVRLENGEYGDEADFLFTREQGKNSIEVAGNYNAAVVRAVKEGEQYVRITHPRAREGAIIVYDVLPPSLPPPPEIDVSESPMIVGKDETRSLRMTLVHGSPADRENFQFQVVENAYAIEVNQHGSLLYVTGIAPGAGKIRIHNPAALRDYDVMVIVD